MLRFIDFHRLECLGLAGRAIRRALQGQVFSFAILFSPGKVIFLGVGRFGADPVPNGRVSGLGARRDDGVDYVPCRVLPFARVDTNCLFDFLRRPSVYQFVDEARFVFATGVVRTSGEGDCAKHFGVVVFSRSQWPKWRGGVALGLFVQGMVCVTFFHIGMAGANVVDNGFSTLFPTPLLATRSFGWLRQFRWDVFVLASASFCVDFNG